MELTDRTPAAAPVALAVPAAIDCDLPCVGCGYNLRTQAIDGVCPECRRAVAESNQPHLLVFAHPRWLRSVRSGATAALISVALVVAVYLCAIVLAGVSPAIAPRDFISLSLVGALIIAGCIWIFAVLRLTSPEPCPDNPTPSRPPLAMWVVGLNVAPFALLGATFLGGFFAATMDVDEAAFEYIFYLSYLVNISFFVAGLALIAYLRRLALRDPAGPSTMLTVLLWSYLVLGIGLITFMAIISFAPLSGFAGPVTAPWNYFFTFVWILAALLLFGWLAWMVCWFVAMLKLRAVFARAIKSNLSDEAPRPADA